MIFGVANADRVGIVAIGECEKKKDDWLLLLYTVSSQWSQRLDCNSVQFCAFFISSFRSFFYLFFLHPLSPAIKGLISNLSAYGYSASEISAAPGQYKLSIMSPFGQHGTCGRFRRGFDIASVLIPDSIATSFMTLDVDLTPGGDLSVTLHDGPTAYFISAPYSSLPAAAVIGLSQPMVVVGGDRGVLDVQAMNVFACGMTCPPCGTTTTTTTGSTTSTSNIATSGGGPTSNAPQSSALPTPSTTTSATAPTTSAAIPCSGSGSPAQSVCVQAIALAQGESLTQEGFGVFQDTATECCSSCCDSIYFYSKWGNLLCVCVCVYAFMCACVCVRVCTCVCIFVFYPYISLLFSHP